MHIKMDINDSLVEACECGDLDSVHGLIKNGADPRYDDSSPIIQAAVYGHLDVVRFLFDRSDPDVRGLIEESCRYGSLDIVRYLISKEGVGTSSFGSGLELASQNGHSSIVELLLSKGADVHSGSDAALFGAVERKHFEIAKLLVEHGATINHETLQSAISNNDLCMVRYLVSNGADVNGPTSYGGNMLYLAHCGGAQRKEIYEYLESEGAYYRNNYCF